MTEVKHLLTKILIFFISFAVFLGILEVSLRLAGKVWQRNRTDYAASGSVSSKDKLITCFGDSYTVGGLGLRETSYPAILSEYFKGSNVRVLNLGICESNTTQVLDAVKNYVSYRKPDVLVFLAGAANKYNFYGMKKINFYRNMRIYKLFHIAVLALKNRSLKQDVLKEFNDNPNTGYCLTPDIQKIISDTKKLNDTEGKLLEIGLYLSKDNTHIPFQNFYRSSENIKTVLDILDTIPDREKEKLCFDMIKIYSAADDYEEAFKYYCIAKKINHLKAAEIFCSCVRIRRKEDKKELDIFNEFISLDRQKGYNALINYYMSGLFFVKDRQEHDRRLEIIKKYISEFENIKDISYETKTTLFDFYCITGDFEKADKILSDLLKYKENPQVYRYMLNMAYYSVYYKKYDKAVGYFLDAFKINPFVDMHCYYYFAKSYRLQSRYDSAYVIKVLKEIEAGNPDLKNDPSFVSVVKLFSDSSSFEKNILDWIESDIEQIIKICDVKNIKLFIQNYPFPYTEINKKLQDIAVKNNISFIDNYSVFKELAEKEGFSKYFIDFDHCTELGHKVIAENVYRALKKEGTVNEN